MTVIVVTELSIRPGPQRITLDVMPIQRQEALPEVESGPRRRVWCTGVGCGRELFDPVSRQRRKGPECDPEPRHTSARFDIDQDTLPGL